ncbi:hypothetical protein VPNG_01469 [Cytospora leucostoma]|uniref:Glucan endo-1,3-beta-glucosidase eglC n=1 Tax=Cytospora leucostoma TaxID=1230097 RepID=A0A423XJX0_9PEZI|nr:hypothetical protein VPNG_01469 [Cytospora leucostoma]
MQSKILSVTALIAGVSASGNYLGFNSGATNADNTAKFQADFEKEMTTAQNLNGAPGKFNAVRLYTNIQAYSTSDPIQAFPAAISTDSSLLLGIWTSGTTSIQNEINALKAALDTHGSDLADRVIGISIGSEDLYRNSIQGVSSSAGPGVNPDDLVAFIKDFKSAFADTLLKDVAIGHVDTSDAWANGTNSAVIDAVDWLGIDEYPYYETGHGNKIENAASLFETAYSAVEKVAGSKKIWVTETGWPYKGDTWDEAVASVANAKTYWDDIGCSKLFGKVPTFWYNLVQDSATNTMSFAITEDLSTTPLFNLTCPAKSTKSTSTSASASSTAASSKSSGLETASSKASGTETASSSAATATGSSSSSGSSGTTSEDVTKASSSKVAASGASAAQLGSSAFAAIAFVAAAFALF